MKLQPLTPFVVAIDPGQKTGVAIYFRPSNNVIDWHTKDFFSVQEFLINSFPSTAELTIFVEVPTTYFQSRDTSKLGRDDLRKIYNSGGVRREGRLLASALRRHGFTVHEVEPIREAKWTAEKMKLQTRISKASSDHERDAARLAIHFANWRPELARQW